MDNSVWVSYSSSDSYAWLACISMTSLFVNNPKSSFNIAFLSNSISPENVELIKGVCRKYNANVHFFDLNRLKEKYDKFKIESKWDFATFGRLFETLLLPETIDKIIHIDCDTIVLSDINELISLDMTNKAIAGVKECLSSNYRKNISIETTRLLFNAGVLVFNLDYFRKNQVLERFLKCINEKTYLEYLDQDVLNISIPDSERIVLPLEYNSYSVLHYFSYKQLLRLRKPVDFYDANCFQKSIKNPVIVHFTTCRYDYGRPWNFENHHPYKNLFLHYANVAGFSDGKLTHVKKKLPTRLVRIIPKGVSCFFSFIFNQVFRPMFKRSK